MKLWMYIAAAVAVVLLIGTIVVYLENQGREKERARIEKENRNAYSKARDSRDGYLACVDGGGVYHFDTGKCGRS